MDSGRVHSSKFEKGLAEWTGGNQLFLYWRRMYVELMSESVAGEQAQLELVPLA